LAIDEKSVAPQPIPDLFPGAPVLLTGRFGTESSALPDGATVTVTGKALDGNEWSQILTATPSANAALSSVWARARVRDLEDRYVSGQFGTADPRLAELEREIIRVSLAYRVLCRFTAFVAVDTRMVNPGGRPKQVTQPVDLPAGWEMSAPAAAPPDRPLRFAAPAAFTSPGPAIPAAGKADLSRSSQLGSPELSGLEVSGPELSGPELSSPELPGSGSAPITPASGRGHARAERTRVPRPVSYGAAAMPWAGSQRPQPLPPVPASVREFASRALRRLRERAGLPTADRIGALAQLADELANALTGFLGDGLAEPESTLLRTFAAELARPVADRLELERRWLYALDVLEPMAGEQPAARQESAAQEESAAQAGRATGENKRPFWKRQATTGTEST
jgi:Ca-activated chloride channel family protein